MIGQSLAHYRVTAALSAGGMGEVYTPRPLVVVLGWQAALGR